MRRKWQLTPVFLPGKSHGQRSLVGYSTWAKGSDMTERACTHTHTPPRCHTHTHPPGVTHTHQVSHTHTRCHTHTHTHPMCLVRGGETVSKSGRLLPVSKPGDEWVWPVPPDPEGTRTLSNRGTFLSLDSHLLLLPNCSLLGC